MAEQVKLVQSQHLLQSVSGPPLILQSLPLHHVRVGSDYEHETQDLDDVVGYDGDDEPSDKEMDNESDYSYLHSGNSRNSSERQKGQGKSRTDCECYLSM